MPDLDLPVPGADRKVWGYKVNAALEAVNEATKVATASAADAAADAASSSTAATTSAFDALDAANSAQAAATSAASLASRTGAKAVGQGELVANVKDFGALGDGTTVDTTAIQSAISAVTAAGGGQVFVPAGVYRVGQLTLGSGVALVGQGSGVSVLAVDNAAASAVLAAGSVAGAATATLTADADPGDTTLTLGSTAALAAGDWIILGDATIPDSNYTRTSGEMLRVRSVDSATQITVANSETPGTHAGVRGTFSTSGWASYQTAQSAAVYKMTPLHGVAVEGLSVRKRAGFGAGDGAVAGVVFKQCIGVTVRGVEVSDLDQTGVAFQDCYGVRMSDCWVHDLSDDAPNGRYGYGVNVGGTSTQVTIANSVFERMRHGVTTNGGDVRGIPDNITVSGCRAANTYSAAFDTHGAGAFIMFTGCTAVAPVGCGFEVRSRYTIVTGCAVYRSQASAVKIGFANLNPFGCRIVGCTIEDTDGMGIEVISAVNDLEIANCSIARTETNGILVAGGSADVRISNNRLTSVASRGVTNGSGIYLASGATVRVTVANNLLNGRGPDGGFFRVGVTVGSGVTETHILGNRASGLLLTSSGYIADSGTGTVLFDNGVVGGSAIYQGSLGTATTSQLTNATGNYNLAKRAGMVVFNTTTGKPVWASGSASTATWVDATGATVHTPV